MEIFPPTSNSTSGFFISSKSSPKEAINAKMHLTRDDLIEIRTLLSIGWKPAKILEFRVALLKDSVIPACEELYPEMDYIYQQDGAPAHKDNLTQEFLRSHTPAFIDKDSWPGYSPDLSVCDYRLWAWMKDRVYRGVMPATLDELRERIYAAWDELPISLIQKWIKEFPDRLQKVIEMKGEQIQQYFNKI